MAPNLSPEATLEAMAWGMLMCLLDFSDDPAIPIPRTLIAAWHCDLLRVAEQIRRTQ